MNIKVLLIICYLHMHMKLVLSFENKANINDLFGEAKCIEEPEDFFSNFLLTLSTENEFTVIADGGNKRNYRSEVNRLVQYHSIDYGYEVVNEEGPSHKKIFNISLKLGDEVYYGSASHKKEAKEVAAKAAIENTSYIKPPEKIKDAEKENKKSPPTVALNNIGAKHGYQIDYYILDPLVSTRIINLNILKEKSQLTNSSFWKEVAHLDQPPKGPFNVEVDVEGKSFYGKGHTIQSAKHDSAIKALQYFEEQGLDKNSPCTMKGHEEECYFAKQKLKSPISQVYEYAQDNRIQLEFNELPFSGPPHKRIFEFECVLGTETTKATGKSKKEAKKNAAQKMLELLPELDHYDEEYSNSESIEGKSKRKRNGKKFKSTFEVAKDTVKNFMNYFSSEDQNALQDDNLEQIDKPSKKSLKKQQKKDENLWSPREKLLEIASALNLKIQFYSMPQEKTGFYSLVNLDLNPKFICLGSGGNIKISEEDSSLTALKFLHKLDLLENVDEKDLDIDRFSFDNFIWLTKEDSSPKE